jgi:hypothetical protein
MTLDTLKEAEQRYKRATAFVTQLRKEWVKLGKPTMAEGGSTGSVLGSHPLVKMIAEAERDADRFAKALKVLAVKHAGPSSVAVAREFAEDLAPSERLRAVK